MKNILVGIDGSEASVAAARWACELAQKLSARLTLLFVLEPTTRWSALQREPKGQEINERDEMMALLDEVATKLPEKNVQKLAEFGPAVETLLEQADRIDADLIVVGARGLSPTARWLLGSVSDRVVRHSSRPVVVIR